MCVCVRGGGGGGGAARLHPVKSTLEDAWARGHACDTHGRTVTMGTFETIFRQRNDHGHPGTHTGPDSHGKHPLAVAFPSPAWRMPALHRTCGVHASLRCSVTFWNVPAPHGAHRPLEETDELLMSSPAPHVVCEEHSVAT